MFDSRQIDEIVAKYPKMKFLKSAAFNVLPKEKREFVEGCVEDAIFWLEMDENKATDGFQFLAASFGMQRAETEANSKGLQGAARSKFLEPHQELLTRFSPFAGLPGVES